MSRLLLDTTVLIDLEWAGDDLGSILLDEDDVAISAVTVVELEVGIRLASDGHRADRRTAVESIVNSVQVLPYDLDVAHRHAVLLAHIRRVGSPRGRHDLIVAAMALASGRTVMTADTSGFVGLPGVLVFDR